MAYFEPGTLIIKGDVRRAYTFNAPIGHVYEYLSNIKNILSQLPNTKKLQIGKLSGKARVLMTINILGKEIDGALDIESTYDQENYTIRLKTPETPLAPVPPGHLSGTFQGIIKAVPTEQGGARVSSRIVIAFDANQVELLNFFPRSLIEASGPKILQEYSENLCDEYAINLLRSFRKWQTDQGRGLLV
ncbi:MAG: DUF1997 domain-containing protein [Chloroflexota bacterium]|nr:DUF1997 domain-containing protein [Chloroflexota bacterium]